MSRPDNRLIIFEIFLEQLHPKGFFLHFLSLCFFLLKFFFNLLTGMQAFLALFRPRFKMDRGINSIHLFIQTRLFLNIFCSKCFSFVCLFIFFLLHTSFTSVEVEYSAGFTPAKLVSGLYQAFVFRIVAQTGHLVGHFVIETGILSITGYDDIGPVPATL